MSANSPLLADNLGPSLDHLAVTHRVQITPQDHRVTSSIHPNISLRAHHMSQNPLLELPSSDDLCKDKFGHPVEEVVSKWKVDKITTSLLVGLYVAALLAAIGHLIAFHHLSGERTANYFIPQGYVVTISNIISEVWGTCLGSCLSVAFSQCFWNIVRSKFISVDTIDELYGVLRNVFLIRPGSILIAPILYVIAILVWSLSVLKTLPPGALIATPAPLVTQLDILIPVYNSTFIGNGTWNDFPGSFPNADISMFGHDEILPELKNDSAFLVMLRLPNNPSPLQQQLAVLFGGRELAPNITPCGINCTYNLLMAAPYLDCNTSSYNATLNGALGEEINDLNSSFVLYNKYLGSYNLSSLNLRQVTPWESGPEALLPANETLALVSDLVCEPRSATYSIDISYDADGARNISYSVDSTDNLSYLSTACQQAFVMGAFGQDYGLELQCTLYLSDDINDSPSLNSSSTYPADLMPNLVARSTLQEMSIYSLFQELASVLNGSIPAFCEVDDYVNVYRFCSTSDDITLETTAPIVNTFFATIIPNGVEANIDTSTTQDLLNEALFNVTMTYAASSTNRWNQTVTANVTSYPLTYSFSQPLNLILPYFVPLLLAFPVLVYTILILYHQNRVSAPSDSFIQILMTTTGSKALSDAAAGGCLGGDGNVPERLKEMKIRFGDLTSRDNAGIRRAGFGVEGEVKALRRSGRYGFSSGGF